MATFTAVARPNRTKKSEVRLYVRISHGQETAFVSASVSVPKSDWNASRSEVRKSHAHAGEIGRILARMVDAGEAEWYRLRASQMDEDAPPLSVMDALRAAVSDAASRMPGALPRPARASARAPEAPGLVAYARLVADGHEARGGFSSAAKVRAVAAKVEAFAGEVAMEAVTPAWLATFDAFLARPVRSGGCGNALNTRGTAMRVLRALLRKAAADGHAAAAPFDAGAPGGRHVIRTEKTHRDRLSWSEVEALWSIYASPDEAHAGASGRPSGRSIRGAEPVRDAAAAWLLALYLLGMRVGDVLSLTPADVVRSPSGAIVGVRYRMAKTGTPKMLALPERGRQIVAAYLERRGPQAPTLHPGLDSRDVSTPAARFESVKAATAAINANLGRIAGRVAPGKKLTMHVARYTLGALAKGAGFSDDEIQTAYAHGSGAVTRGYLGDLDAEAVDRRVAGMFDSSAHHVAGSAHHVAGSAREASQASSSEGR